LKFKFISNLVLILAIYVSSLVLAPPVLKSQPLTICRNVNKPITDFTTIRDTIRISGMSWPIIRMKLIIDTVIHTWDSDLRFYLSRGSIGTRAINEVGGSGDNFIGTNIQDTTGICQIGNSACNTAPFTGTYMPSLGYSFSGFFNQTVNGDWILSISDTVAGDSGTLRSWCLFFDTWLLGLGNTTSIPNKFSLSQNYPNPFNPSTKFEYHVPKNAYIKISLYDVSGKFIKTLVDEVKHTGVYEYEFNAAEISSGVYFYKMETEGYSESRKMFFIK